eukprot:6458206-Amphidinium_carterae.1
MANAVQTWKSTVNGLLLLCNAVRNTQMQLLAIGVSTDKSDLVVRYGVMSVYFLYKEQLLLPQRDHRAVLQELEDAHIRDEAVKQNNQVVLSACVLALSDLLMFSQAERAFCHLSARLSI